MPSRSELDAAYRRNVQALRSRQESVLRRIWSGLGVWLGPGDYIDRWLAAAVPVMLGTQRQVAAQTVAYQNLVLGVQVALDVDQFTGDALRGVDHRGTYQRGFSDVRKAVAAGRPFDDAVRAGLRRSLDIAGTDVQMAKVRAADSALGEAGVKRYRRVLNGSVNCGLCVAAASQVYRVGSLMPLHPGCDCGVAPMVSAADRAAVEQADDTYRDLLEKTGSTSTADLHREKVDVVEHGELGPVLTWREHHFKTPRESHAGSIPRVVDQPALDQSKELERRAMKAIEAGDRDAASRLREEATALRRVAFGTNN